MGKVPYLDVNGTRVRESSAILEYLEEAFPQKPLLPSDPLERARVRELVIFIELHLELVARRMYVMLGGGKPVSDEAKQRVEKDLVKGVRALKAVVKFEPFIAGKELTIADCAAFVHLPLVTLVTKNFFGRDFLEDLPQMKPYLKMLGERPAFAKVNEDRRAATAAAKK
jgi:glutathione S-transferase